MNVIPPNAETQRAEMAALGVTEDVIERLVRAFYGKVRQDPDLGPIFAEKIQDDWEPHLQTMMNFWSSVVLKSGRFKGSPVLKHRMLTMLSPDHFVIWLNLFGSTAREVCEPAVADVFCDRAAQIAQSLKQNVFPQSTPYAAPSRPVTSPTAR